MQPGQILVEMGIPHCTLASRKGYSPPDEHGTPKTHQFLEADILGPPFVGFHAVALVELGQCFARRPDPRPLIYVCDLHDFVEESLVNGT